MDFKRALNENIKFDSTGELAIDGVKASDIVKEFGSATYVYSMARIREKYNSIFSAYHRRIPNFSIHYSMKANANFAILKALIALGSGIDCVSGGEVFKALKAGCPANHIVFAGVGKTYDEISFAVSKGVAWFDVENVLELSHIAAAAKEHGKVGHVNVALRVNPDVEADTMPQIATGHGTAKFGLPIKVVADVLSKSNEQYPELCFKGLHLHIGSQLRSVDSTVKAIQQTLDGVKPYLSGITHLNIGGGLPANYGDEKPLPTMDDFAEAVAPLIQNFHVMLEPGRSIVGEAGLLLTKVLYRKEQDGQKMIIVDASMTDLMRPALYSAKHPMGSTKIWNPARELPDVIENHYEVVGPVCESTDVLRHAVLLEPEAAQPGAVLAILTAGAYGSSMGTNYNARPLIAEVVVDGGKAILARRRQTIEDLIRDEVFA